MKNSNSIKIINESRDYDFYKSVSDLVEFIVNEERKNKIKNDLNSRFAKNIKLVEVALEEVSERNNDMLDKIKKMKNANEGNIKKIKKLIEL